MGSEGSRVMLMDRVTSDEGDDATGGGYNIEICTTQDTRTLRLPIQLQSHVISQKTHRNSSSFTISIVTVYINFTAVCQQCFLKLSLI